MKKIIGLIVLMSLSFVMFSQTTVFKSLGKDRDNAFYYGEDSDTIGAGATSLTKSIYKRTDSKTNCHVTVWLDSLGGTAEDVNVTLRGKTSDFESYDSITSVVWSGTSSDTLLDIETSSSYMYRFWDLKINSATGGFNVALDTLEFNFFKN